MDVEEKGAPDERTDELAWWNIPVSRRSFSKIAGGVAGGLVVARRADRAAALRLALAPAYEAVAEFGRDLLEFVGETNPDLLKPVRREEFTLESLQASDLPRFSSPPPEETRFYLEAPEAEKVVAAGFVHLFYDGQYSFVVPDHEAPLTSREVRRRSMKIAARVLRLFRDGRRRLPERISDLNDHLVGGALVTDELVVRELLVYLEEELGEDFSSATGLEPVPVFGTKTAKGVAYDYLPQLEEKQRRRAWHDFETAVNVSRETDSVDRIDLSPRFQAWLADHFGDKDGKISPEIEKMAFTAKWLHRQGKINMNKVIEILSRPDEIYRRLLAERERETKTAGRRGVFRQSKAPARMEKWEEQDDFSRTPAQTAVSRRNFLKEIAARGVVSKGSPAAAVLEVVRRVDEKVWETFWRRLSFILRENPAGLLPGTTKILARNGEVLFRYYPEENREFFSLDKLRRENPFVFDWVLKAVAIEDGEFFEHPGLVLESKGKSLIETILGRRRGGSSLTEQTVKNLAMRLDKENRLTPYRRKAVEALLAVVMEQFYRERYGGKEEAKRKILETYLNVVSFGPNCTGLATAARDYFDKEVDELDPKEIIFLFGLIQDPVGRYPLSHQGLVRARRAYRQAIKGMLHLGNLSPKEAREFSKTPPRLDPFQPGEAGDFYEYVLGAAGMAKIPAEVMRRGLVIRTTLDMEIQKGLSSLLRENRQIKEAASRNIHDWAVVIRDEAGGIAAWVGKVMREHLVGSTCKPALALAGLEVGKLNGVIDDTPPRIKLADGSVYSPTNFDGLSKKDASLAYCLGLSHNSWVARAAGEGGLYQPFVWMIERLGVVDEIRDPDVAFALPLGIFQTDALRLSHLPLTLINGGVVKRAMPILSVAEQDGRLIYDSRGRNLSTQRVVDARAVDKVTTVISGRNPEILISLPPRTIIKTGTSAIPWGVEREMAARLGVDDIYKEGFVGQDLWVTGATETENGRYAVVPWMGNLPKGDDDFAEPVKTASGFPRPIFVKLIEFLQAQGAAAAGRLEVHEEGRMAGRELEGTDFGIKTRGPIP
jgi:membrane peptidoglycan carboxypeptidase